MNVRRVALRGLLVLMIGAAILGWYEYVLHPVPVACGFCSRPLHANLTVTAEIAGRRAQVCCAACAISEANQEHKSLRLVTVRDYQSGRPISPESAWFVEGSRAKACDHDALRMNEMRETVAATYDRCSPGTFAFAERTTAEAFIAQNGGSVASFAQLMREANFQ